MEFSLILDEELDFLAPFRDFLGGESGDTRLTLPAFMGSGEMFQWRFPGGVSLFRLKGQVKYPLSVKVNVAPDAYIHTLLLDLQSGPILDQIEDQMVAIRSAPRSGVAFIQTGPIHVHVKPKVAHHSWVISFTQKFLSQYLSKNPNPALETLLQPIRNRYQYDELSLEQEYLLRKMQLEAKSPSLERLQWHAWVLEFVYHELEKLGRRNSATSKKVHPDDFERLLQVRNHISSRLSNPPSIPELAREAGFSESKLKRLFKEVFGKPVYQYIQYARMLEARNLLLSGKYNLSQAAFQVGYANLAHFSAAFEKHLGFKPGDLLRGGSFLPKPDTD